MRARALLAAGVAGLLLAACGGARAPAAAPGLVLVGEPEILTKSFGLRDVVGRVRNTDTEPRSGNIQTTLWDAEGKIIDVVNAHVDAVRPGEEATYQGVVAPAAPPVARLEARFGVQYRTKG